MDDPLAYFHLAGACFNGQIVDYSPEIGLRYLVKAALEENRESLFVILNVFEACDAPLPEGNEEKLLAMVEDYGVEYLLAKQSNVFPTPQQNRLEPQYLLSKTWTSRWPERYLEFVHSGQTPDGVASLVTGSVLRRVPKQGTKWQVFDYIQTATSNLFGVEDLDLSMQRDLRVAMNHLDCANSCGSKVWFTLLQYAAVTGDMVLAETLVMELGVSVDSYGETPGWTPLLLSCRRGNFAMAKLLIEHGANPAVREDSQGYTILHLLHQFIERQHCEEMLDIVLSAGLDINSPLEGGITPLHSLFSDWDYSRGVAAELLLAFGGDPTRPVTNEHDDIYGFSTPLGYASQALDVALVRSMLSSSRKIVSISGRQADQRLNKAKAQAIISLFRRSRFYYMGIGGKGYERRIEEILSLLVNSDVAAVHSTSIEQKEGSPWPVDIFLSTCVATGWGFFTERYLNVFPETVVDYPCHTLPSTLLLAAIERRSREAIHAILHHGGDLLTKNEDGRNSFHYAAQYFPEVLIELVKLLEDSPERQRDMSVAEILEQRDHTGYTVFGVLLTEGYDDERHIAESLRLKYNLRHDYILDSNGSWVTFGGSMIMGAVREGLVPIENIEYLLGLDPPLEWNASSAGKSLLSIAVVGFPSCK